MARLRLTPPPNSSPQSDPNPAQPGTDPQAGLPVHLQRPRPLPASPAGGPLSPEAWQAQFAQTQAAGGLGALAAQDAAAEMPAPVPQPPLSMGGRIAEGFEAVGRGGLAALASGTQAIRAPFYSQEIDPTTGAPPVSTSTGFWSDLVNGTPDEVPTQTVVNDPIGQHLGQVADEQRARIAQMQSPASRLAGQGAEIVGGVVPYLNPITGATSGAGNAMLENKSDLGVGLNAALGAVPGGAGRGVARGMEALMGRFATPIVSETVGQGALGAGMAAGTAAETQLMENNPDLARQEWGNVAPMAGGLGALGALTALATRGRGAFRTAEPLPSARQMDLAPVEGGPAVGEPSPFQQDVPFAGQFGDRAGQSPFGGQFDQAPRPDIQPEMRASTVSADPVLTGPDGRPALPDIVPGEAPILGGRPGGPFNGELPVGEPGEWNAAPEAMTGPQDLRGRPTPQNLPGEAEGRALNPADGYRDFNPAPTLPRAPELGVRRALTRPPDIQPQRTDPTSLGEAPIRDPLAEYKQNGIDPNGETQVGAGYMDVTDADHMPIPEPLPNGNRRGNNTPQTDPYGNIDERLAADRRQQAFGDEVAQDPLDAFDPQQIGDLARRDTSLPETQLQLDPVAQRAEMATEPELAPPMEYRHRGAEGRQQLGAAETRVTPAKPGLAHLSPEAQAFVASAKPGERELLRDSIDYFKQNPDPQGDLGNLKMVLDMARAKRERKPGARPKLTAPEKGAGEAPALAPRPPEAEGTTYRAPSTADTGSPAVPSREIPGKNPEPSAPAVEKPTEGSIEHIQYGGIPTEGLKPALRGIGGAIQGVGRGAKALIDVWSKRLYRVVSDLPGGKPAAEKAQKVLDRTRELMGKFDPDRQRFLTEMRDRGPRAKAARASFAEVEWDGDAGFARINDVLDGTAKPRPFEQPAVNAYRRAFLDTGKAAEAAGYQIGSGNKMVKFTADPNRTRAPRIGTRDLHWYAARPADPETKRLAGEIAKFNAGMTADDVLSELNFWNERGVSKRGMAEDARTIEHFPTHYRDSEGNIIQLLENDPQRIIDAVTRRFPARVAYVEQFGQGGTPKELMDIQAASGKEGQAAAQNLFRALNGMPLDDLAQGLDNARPGSAISFAQRALNVPWTAWKGIKLSMAPLANLPETIGKARSIGGSNPLKLVKAGFDVSWMNRNSDAIIDDLANRGAMTRDILDWYYNKSDLPETFNRYTMNSTGAVNRSINEFNERLAARLADQWTQALKAGKGGAIDKFRLKVLDFKPGEIDAMMAGKAPKSLYNAALGRAVEWAQGSTSQAAERSRAGGSRLWNLVTIADRFSQMNLNRNFDAWAKAGRVLADGNSSWKDRLAGVAFAADLTAGQTAAAALTLMMRAMVVGGAGALADKAFGSPLGLQDYLLDSMKYALLGGPMQAVVQGSERSQPIGQSLAESLLPVSTIQDMTDMLAGNGKYEGMNAMESVAQFLKSGTPITPAIANIAAVTGLGSGNPKLDAGIREFWKWRQKYAPVGKATAANDGEDSMHAFHAAMRKAATAIRDGVYPGEAINEALQIKDPKTIASSLRGHKLLKGLKPEQVQTATEYLGPETMSQLYQYDDLIENWAAAVSPKRKR